MDATPSLIGCLSANRGWCDDNWQGARFEQVFKGVREQAEAKRLTAAYHEAFEREATAQDLLSIR